MEVDTSRETGGLYETGDRGWVYKLSKEAISKRKYVPGQWTNLELRTSGWNVTAKINGVICSELKNDKGKIKGYFGL